MSDTSTNLILPYLAAGQAQKHVTVNATIQKLDALVQLAVVSATTSAEPGSPADGAVYILPAGKTGAHWGPLTNLALAYYVDGAWGQITPREGFLAYVKDTDLFLRYDGAAWAEPASSTAATLAGERDAGQLQGFKNRLINGSFRIDQRAAASNADDTYGPDRWNLLTQSGTIAYSILTNPETGAPTGVRLTQSQVSAQRMGIAQIIESGNCRDLRSVVASLAGRLRCSVAQAINFAILEWTGAADIVTSDVVNDWTDASLTAGHFFLGSNVTVAAAGAVTPAANAWTAFSLANKSISSSCNNLIVMVWTAGTIAQNATLDLNRVQLEPGVEATPFELRPFGVEQTLCERYYEAGDGAAGPFWSGEATNGQGYIAPCRFRARKRASPNVTLTSAAAAGFPASSGSVTPTVDGFRENRTANATASGRFYSSNWIADAEL